MKVKNIRESVRGDKTFHWIELEGSDISIFSPTKPQMPIGTDIPEDSLVLKEPVGKKPYFVFKKPEDKPKDVQRHTGRDEDKTDESLHTCCIYT